MEPIKPTAMDPIGITLSVAPVINYALHHNGVKAIHSLTVANNSAEDLSNLKLVIETVPAFAEPLTIEVNFIPAGNTYEIKTIDLKLDADYLASTTERLEGEIRVTLMGDTPLATATQTVTVLAFDQWSGQPNHPELLASFVTPNHPALAPVISRAATFLHQWTGDSSFTGYLQQDPDQVLKQASALFNAIKEENLIYCVSPASFETTGQRIRLCDMVLQQKMGTCMDLTLLYASCLEAVGLYPLLIMTEDHIFTGVWLDRYTFPDAVQDDPSLITKRLADGVNEIAVMETTLVVNGRNASFDQAVEAAERHFLGTQPIECIIDVRRARMCGITPIPQRVQGADGWRIEHDLPDTTGDTYAPQRVGKALDIDPNAFEPESIPKMVQWERKLLDLGLRNNLINLRLSRNVVPVLTTSLDDLEDALADGDGFTVLPRPGDWQSEGDYSFETMHDPGPNSGLVASEYHNKRLRSILTEGELTKAMKTLYRNAKTSLEENGANSLYLVLGLLRWYENPRSQQPRYAPVILLPVEIVRRMGSKSYTLRLRDEEPQINVTLLEKMKQDFGINVSGLDPLPMDDKGVDLRRVFTVLRKALMGQDRWDVLESAYLGIFSFSQFVMWSDLRHRADALLSNKIVRSLIDGKLCWDAKPMVIGDRVPEDSTLLPMPADASQLFAIQAACKGESFVLHGPPGTGKSQTITSLIANALAQGKSVLFVAEKKAALEVVQKRLAGIGVDPFCLELHSNKTKKRDVLDQLRTAIEVTQSASPAEYADKAARLQELREGLDVYAAQLHAPLPCGYSLFNLINEYEEYAEVPELVAFDAAFAATADRHMLDSHVILLERLVAAGKAVGHPHDHPLAAIGVRQYSQHLRHNLPATVGAYRDACQAFIPHAVRLAEMLSFGKITDPAGLQRLLTLAKSVAACGDFPYAWTQVEKPFAYFGKVQEMADHFMAYYQRKTYLEQYWKPEFFAQDGAALLKEYNALQEQWLVAKALGGRRLVQRLSAMALEKVPPVAESLQMLYRMQSEQAAAEALLQEYGDDLGGLYSGDTTDWAAIRDKAAEAQKHLSALHDHVIGHTACAALCADSDAIAAAGEMVAHHDAFCQTRAACYGLLGLTDAADDNWLDGQLALCDALIGNSDQLKEWITFVGIASEAQDAGLGPVVEAYRGGAAHEDIVPAYRKAALQVWIMTAIDEQGIFNAFSGAVFNEKIAQYKRLDAEFTDLVRQELFCRLAANIPQFTGEAAQSSELGILQRAIRSGGRGISIRRLFEQLPNLLPRLCPCMLMSPISAAQYLTPTRPPFDIVVFDEASQLPTCKAVGVLARGENAVIVGDPKQMPPTAFFATNAVDEEHIEEEDLESILDDCLAINMPQTHLLWHYRSRHESLISFSNRQFYENKLFTFPSVNDRESKVSLVPVDGVFERSKGRRNVAEAQAVVKEICRRCHDPELSKYSVGVITFNIPQQLLIDDMLSDACEKDPELERWMYEGDEPLFVKNLENVQGDEREVILFSIGYGPDEQGKVYMNFGPLNRDGGWRRLNVAVSRARSEMVVFSTLKPEQIDLNKTSAQGVAALKAFLMYAAGHPLALDEHASRQLQGVTDGIARSLCALLKEQGYTAVRNVGRSEYKIDVGVVDPADPDKYLLGILLDGGSYGAAKTTHDREVAQLGILRSLGWNTLRVWTMDWWDNRHKEIARIVAELERLQAGNPEDTPAEDTPTEEPPAEETAPEESPMMPEPVTEEAVTATQDPWRVPYAVAETHNQPATIDALMDGAHDYLLLRTIQTVLDAEAPLRRTVLWKRVLNSFGITHASSRLTAYLERLATDMAIPMTVDGAQAVCWQKGQDPEAYPYIRYVTDTPAQRDPAAVPWVEAVNAMVYVLHTQVGMPRDGLAREAVRLLGYRHLVGAAAALADDAFARLTDQGLVTVDANQNCALSPEGNVYATRRGW